MEQEGAMSELLPCPFCGGEAELRHVSQLWEPRDNYWAACKCCHMSGKTYRTEAEAIAAWNTRAELTCHINELDALTQTLSMVNCCSWGECSECGCLTPTDSVFCIECGAKVVEQ